MNLFGEFSPLCGAAASYAPWDRASLIRGMSDVWVISTMAFTSIKGLKADMVVN